MITREGPQFQAVCLKNADPREWSRDRFWHGPPQKSKQIENWKWENVNTWDKTFGSDLIYVHTTFVERFEFHIHFIGSMNVDPFDEICKKRRKRVKSEFIKVAKKFSQNFLLNSDEDW